MRGGSRSSDDYSGIGKVAPVLAGLFLVAGLSSLALPGLSTFISEFLVLVGTYTRYPFAAVLATLGIVLAALYILLMYQKTMQGPLSAAHARMKDLSLREVMAVAPLVALMLVLGFYPKPLTDVITPSVTAHAAGRRRHRPGADAGHRPGRHLDQPRGAVVPTDIGAPSIDYASLLPILVVLGAAVVGVLVEAFVPAASRRLAQLVVAVAGLLGALAAVVALAGDPGRLVVEGAIAVDGPALFLQGTLCVLGVAGVLLLSEDSLDSSGGDIVARAAVRPGSREDVALAESSGVQTEVYPLAMFALGGMLLFPACNNLILMFIALEVLSLPLYLMSGLARRRRLLSQEAAVKYFLLGAFASAFFLYGVALLYGYAGTVDLGGIFAASGRAGSNELLMVLGLAMLVVGLLFKIGAVPFQAWTPDVYQGAPTPVTALMASCTKVAAFGALLRVLYVGFVDVRWDWRPMMWGIAILTMVVGALLAITQTDVKRMLAYSSVAHTGFLLIGVVALDRDGLGGTLFYLLTYGFTTLSSFAVVSLVRDSSGEATHLAQWTGLARKSPFVASSFALLLFALAGIPLTSGFTAKFAVFRAATDDATALVVVGVVTSAVTAFFYARVVVLMFFHEPAPDGPTVAVPSAYTAVAIALGLAVTVALGVYPQPLLDLADKAALFVR